MTWYKAQVLGPEPLQRTYGLQPEDLSRTERPLTAVTQVSSLSSEGALNQEEKTRRRLWEKVPSCQEGASGRKFPVTYRKQWRRKSSPATTEAHLTAYERHVRQRYRRRESLTFHTYLYQLVCPWMCTYQPDPIHMILMELWEIEDLINQIIIRNYEHIGQYHG